MRGSGNGADKTRSSLGNQTWDQTMRETLGRAGAGIVF